MSNGKFDSERPGSPKKVWIRPELMRLVPGSAEAGTKNDIADGGTQGNVKS